MSSFLTRAIDAQVRVELVRDLFKLEGLEPVPEDVALALEDDDVAREEIISFVVARFSVFIGVVVYDVYVIVVAFQSAAFPIFTLYECRGVLFERSPIARGQMRRNRRRVWRITFQIAHRQIFVDARVERVFVTRGPEVHATVEHVVFHG